VPNDGFPFPWPSAPTTVTTTSAGILCTGYKFLTKLVTLVWSNSDFLATIRTTVRRLCSSRPWSKAVRQTASITPETLTARCFAGVLDAFSNVSNGHTCLLRTDLSLGLRARHARQRAPLRMALVDGAGGQKRGHARTVVAKGRHHAASDSCMHAVRQDASAVECMLVASWGLFTLKCASPSSA
jgi:hypothetical protein